MNVIVTGSAGFLGFHICMRLLKLGYTVIGIDNLNDDYNPLLKHIRLEDLEKHKNYINIKKDVIKVDVGEVPIDARQSIEAVIHLASKDYQYEMPNEVEYTKYLMGNVISTASAFELAHKLNAKKFIFASTSTLYGRSRKPIFTEKDIVPKPISPQGASKLAAEKVVEYLSTLYYIPSVTFRIGTVYGPIMRPNMLIPNLIYSIKNDREISLFSPLSSKRDYVYVEDVVEYFIASLTKRISHQILNLGSGNTYDIETLIRRISSLMGYNYDSLKIKEAKVDYNQIVVKDIALDISKLKKIFKFEPSVSLETGLKKTVEFYTHNPDILSMSV